MTAITPEQLRKWAHHTHAACMAAGEAVILDVDFIAKQFRAHAAALEELARLKTLAETPRVGLIRECAASHDEEASRMAAERERGKPIITILDAINIGGGNVYGALIYWQERTEKAEAELARLKAPVDVAGIVAQLQATYSFRAGMRAAAEIAKQEAETLAGMAELRPPNSAARGAILARSKTASAIGGAILAEAEKC